MSKADWHRPECVAAPHCRCAEEEIERLRAGLESAIDGLWRAKNMLGAINASDPSADRRKAVLRAQEAENAARRALAPPSPPSGPETPRRCRCPDAVMIPDGVAHVYRGGTRHTLRDGCYQVAPPSGEPGAEKGRTP